MDLTIITQKTMKHSCPEFLILSKSVITYFCLATTSCMIKKKLVEFTQWKRKVNMLVFCHYKTQTS